MEAEQKVRLVSERGENEDQEDDECEEDDEETSVDVFKQLGVSRTATPAEVRKAYLEVSSHSLDVPAQLDLLNRCYDVALKASLVRHQNNTASARFRLAGLSILWGVATATGTIIYESSAGVKEILSGIATPLVIPLYRSFAKTTEADQNEKEDEKEMLFSEKNEGFSDQLKMGAMEALLGAWRPIRGIGSAAQCLWTGAVIGSYNLTEGVKLLFFGSEQEDS